MAIMFLVKHWRLLAVAALLAGAYAAGYSRADNAWQARNGRELAQAQTEFKTRLETALADQQTERDRQRRIADEQLRQSQARAQNFQRLLQRAADRPVPDCALSPGWLRDIRGALAGDLAGTDPAPAAGGLPAGAVPGAAGPTGRDLPVGGDHPPAAGRAVPRMREPARGAGQGGDR